MNTKESAKKFSRRIWRDIEEPLAIVTSGTILFFFAILFLKIGTMIVYYVFTEETWFAQYLDFFSVLVLILSYGFFMISSLFIYFYNKKRGIKSKREGEIA